MDITDIAELLLLLIFFLISPLIRRYREKQQRQQGAPVPPAEGRPTEGGGPVAPQPPSPTARSPLLPNYNEYILNSLKDLRAQAVRLQVEMLKSPLYQMPDLKPLVAAVTSRASEEITHVTGTIDRAIGDDEGAADASELARANETLRARLEHARTYASLLATVAEQRLSPSRRRRLALLDKLLEQLGTGNIADTGVRRRWALLWQRDPILPSALIGDGTAGVATVTDSRLGLASEWVNLARGVGFDLLGQFPQLADELRRASAVGPLRDRPLPGHDYASARFDMLAALTAWTPNLAADVVGALLLGHVYAVGLVQIELARNVRPSSLATVYSDGGHYHPEPPLMVRLAIIDEVLAEAGWADATNGMRFLEERIELPSECLYVLPNRQTRRVLLDPLIDYMRQVAASFYSTRLSSIADRRLSEVVSGGLTPLSAKLLDTTQRAFVDGEIPRREPVVLLGAAVLAEANPAATVRSFEGSLMAALSERRPRRARRQAEAALSDRVLLRDALVLSEIL